MFSHIKELFTRPSGYTIGKSVRLRSSASAYFNRTPASATNQKTWTWSGWVKRGALSSGSYMDLFSALTGANDFTEVRYHYNANDDALVFSYVVGGTGYYIYSSNLFRDPSAWYHIVCSIDTTQATSTNRVKLYVNGVQVTQNAGGSGYPLQNANTSVNAICDHRQGAINTYGRYFDGYLTEINFIDGQALTPSSFGTTNALTGVWQPAKYTGTYGTNGFYLNFSSNGTAAALGTDFSGNSNTWTVNNVSVTAGVTYDSMIDSPTVSAVSSNYCVLNPLQPASTTVVVPTDGNLKMTGTASGNNVTGTMAIGTTTYFEGTVITGGGTVEFGVKNLDTGNTYVYDSNGNKYLAGTGTAYGATFTTNDIIGVAVDPTNLTLQFYKNGTSQGVISSAFPSGNYVPFFYASNTNASAANFGQRPFTYTPPTGFVALNTYNLPASTITNGAAYMAASLYTGTNATLAINNAVNSVSFQPDFVWIKSRNGPSRNTLFDSVRGNTKVIWTDSTDAEGTETAGTGLSSFNSNGFTLGTDIAGTSGSTNGSGTTYVGWNWKAGGTSSSNTNGSITSTVSVGATQGFSVVSWTPSAGNDTVGHGLGVAPSLIIAKPRTLSSAWPVYHVSLGASQVIYLNTTAAASTGTTTWGGVTPTSTVFSTNSWFSNDGATIAYCFAAVKGFSAFGSYTGNGSSDGPFVYTGFRPRWVMVKCTSTTGSWVIWDTSRNTYNATDELLIPNSSGVAITSYPIDVLSNGFKIRSVDGSYNASSQTYIYATFAENPFRNALAR